MAKKSKKVAAPEPATPTIMKSWPGQKSPRALQVEALAKITEAFDSGKRFVVLEAPTGTGKTHCAMTLAKHYGSAWLCTLTKALQQQYMTEPDFKDLGLAEIKGKSAYRCEDARSTCEVGSELYEGSCEHCPYQIAKARAYAAPVAVCNYMSFIYNVTRSQQLKEEGTQERELLILDEGHELEDVLMGYISIEIRKASIPGRYDVPMPTDATNVESYFKWLQGLREHLRSRVELERTPERRAALKRQIDRIGYALRKREDAHWIVDPVTSQKGDALGFDLKPLTVSPFGEIFFKTAKRVLLMSGTILSSEAVCTSLGIDPSDAAYIELPCTFPKENRPIRAFNLDMRKDARDESWPMAVKIIDDILKFHGDQKGLLLAPSTEMLRYIEKSLPREQASRLLLAYGDKRQEKLKEHFETKRPTVLAASGMWEGIDLFEDRSRFQIIAALPRPYWGSAQVRERAKLHWWWYDWRTFSKTVQGLGRSIRSGSDTATSYVLDAAFAAHAGRLYNNLIPQWMRDAIVKEA